MIFFSRICNLHTSHLCKFPGKFIDTLRSYSDQIFPNPDIAAKQKVATSVDPETASHSQLGGFQLRWLLMIPCHCCNGLLA